MEKQNINQKNIWWESCREQDLRLWECPSFLFVFAGIVTMIFMLVAYFVASIYANPEIAVASIFSVTMLMMVIAYIVDRVMNKVAKARKALAQTNTLLKKALHDAQKADTLRENFVSMVVHDLRSPLTGILFLAQTLQNIKRIVSLQEYHMSGKAIEASTQKILRLVNNLLLVQKIEAKAFPIQKKHIHIVPLLRAQIGEQKVSAQKHDVRLQLLVPKKLPLCFCDPENTERIIENLIQNALKYTKTKSTVSIGAFLHTLGKSMREEAKKFRLPWRTPTQDEIYTHAPTAIVIAVTDEGPGIPRSEQDKIFDRFHQIIAHQKKTEGVGLGLAIAKGITQAQGGIIGLTSTKGRGSTFYFTLPVKQKTYECEKEYSYR